MKEVTVGIDIGGTNSVFGLVDREGNILANGSVSSTKHAEVENFVAEVSEKIRLAIPANTEILGLGIGAPNANYFSGTIEHAPNLRWKGIIDLVSLFRQHFNLPVVLTNDANAAAMGEMLYGAAQGMQDFMVITLGTGVGSGIVVNGNVIYGHDGFAGELGHAIAIPEGRLCTCGRRGCLETYASARGIRQTVTELLEVKDTPSILREIPGDTLSPKEIYDAAEKGDKIALEAFEYTGKVIGIKLADAVTYTSPKAFIFFGGVAKAGDYLLFPAKKYLEQSILNLYQNKVTVLPSGLPETNAAILGAGALCWKELEKVTS